MPVRVGNLQLPCLKPAVSMVILLFPPMAKHGYGHRKEALFMLRMDNGSTWQQVKGIADNLRVIADKVNPKKFYALSLTKGKLYTSADGGNTFTEQALNNIVTIPKTGTDRGDNRGGQDRIYAVPVREGDLWLAAFDGLYHSTDGGKIFLKLNGVEEIHGFGFGK